jgi:glycerol-1-phosphatase
VLGSYRAGMTDSLPRTWDSRPLVQRYPGLICDLDGVVYRGPDAIPGAVETLNMLIVSGIAVSFATNNASRPPGDVRTHLRALGVAEAYDVATSSQAAAAHLADLLDPGSPVLAVGGPGVTEALAEAGLTPLRLDELADAATDAATDVTGRTPLAVMQGLGTEVTWRELAEVAHRVQDGTPWVVTNLDIMLPTARGPAPGNGALVAAVRTATDAVPHVVGKPGPALFDRARSGLGTRPEATLVCGDRLDTDIAGAHAAGLDSLLVLSGACSLRDLAVAAADERPTYVAEGLTGMLAPLTRIVDAASPDVTIGPDGQPVLPSATGPQHLAAVVAAAWAAVDAGEKVDPDPEAWRAVERRLALRVP